MLIIRLLRSAALQIKKRGRDAAGRSIMQGAAAFAAAAAAGAIPSAYVQTYGLAAGGTGPYHLRHMQHDDDDGPPVSSVEGDGSDDGSYEDLGHNPVQSSSAPLD